MANTIQVKRGAFASLPVLAAGEFGFCTDTFQTYIGNGGTNYELVMHQLFGAQTILAATSDNTPAALTVDAQRVVGRITAGNVAALTGAQLMTILTGQSGADFSMNTHKITGVTDPTDPQDAATKAYTDAISGGVDPKDSCRVATTEALPACTAAGSGVGKTLTANANAVLTIDGVATVLNDRILVKNQGTGTDNGIYKVTTEGTSGVAAILTRAVDFDGDTEVTGGAYTFVCEGAANADEGWVLTTNDTITVDTTALVFSQFSAAIFVDTFLELTDTPVNYTAAGLKVCRVNTGATAIEFVGFADTYLDNTAGGVDAEVAKAITSNVMYDHGVATTGVHGAGGNTLLHSASTIDGGAFV